MPTTDFGTLSTARKMLWAAEIWIAGRDANFWMSNGFVGGGMNNVIQRITELTRTERGDQCIMQLVADLQGDGIVGDNLLSGNEEPLFNDSVTLRIDLLRAGVRSKGQMAEQRTVIRFRSTVREKLAFWLANIIDELLFLTASGVSFAYNNDGSTRLTSSQLTELAFASDVTPPSSGRQKYANLATSTATLQATDTFAWHMVVSTQAYAKRKRMKQIRSGGREWFCLVLSTEQCRDLKNDPTYQTLTSRAAPRGPDNPLFRNALAVIDGVVIYEHNKVQTTLGLASGSKWGAAGTVDGAQALFLGAQAMGFATINDIEYQEADVNDYKNRPGIAVGRILGMLKPQFTSIPDNNTKQDFGIVNLYTASAATI